MPGVLGYTVARVLACNADGATDRRGDGSGGAVPSRVARTLVRRAGVRARASDPEGGLGWSRRRSKVDRTHVLPLEFGREMPVVVRGEGVWIEDTAGRRYLDAMSGGSMAATLGHGRQDIVAAARAQAEKLAFVHNERLTNPAQERLADELDRGGARGLHAGPIHGERRRRQRDGDPDRAQLPRRARRSRSMAGDLAGAGVPRPDDGDPRADRDVPGLHGPFGPYLPQHLHIPPSTWRFDPSGEAALEALDRALDEAGPGNVSAFFCEPISAAALPAYTPPRAILGGPGRAARSTRLPRVLRRGRDGGRTDR